MTPELIRHRGQIVNGVITDLHGMAEWKPSVAQVRDVIQRHHVVASDFSQLALSPEALNFMPTQREVELLDVMCNEAVTAGRFIDMGYIPNEVLKFGGDRGGPMWNDGGLGMPFSDPWILYHHWEEGVAVYLINPSISGKSFEVAEIQPTRFGNELTLLILDRGQFDAYPLGQMPSKRYRCTVAPGMLRFWADPRRSALANNGARPEQAAAGNIGDPVMCALLILNTRNIERETVRAPEKLQRARLKARKAPIPSYERVLTLPYVTAVQARGQAGPRGDSKGGTHASPVAHIRMGHPRNYASGRSIFIKDTLVNVPPEQREQFKSQRSHYTVNVNARQAVQRGGKDDT